jgi:hypothetical protein
MQSGEKVYVKHQWGKLSSHAGVVKGESPARKGTIERTVSGNGFFENLCNEFVLLPSF